MSDTMKELAWLSGGILAQCFARGIDRLRAAIPPADFWRLSAADVLASFCWTLFAVCIFEWWRRERRGFRPKA